MHWFLVPNVPNATNPNAMLHFYLWVTRKRDVNFVLREWNLVKSKNQLPLRNHYVSSVVMILDRNILTEISSFQELKVHKKYPVLILNELFFSVLLTYIVIDSLHFFLKCTQNNLEYLVQNMICQVIEIYHSTLELIF